MRDVRIKIILFPVEFLSPEHLSFLYLTYFHLKRAVNMEMDYHRSLCLLILLGFLGSIPFIHFVERVLFQVNTTRSQRPRDSAAGALITNDECFVSVVGYLESRETEYAASQGRSYLSITKSME